MMNGVSAEGQRTKRTQRTQLEEAFSSLYRSRIAPWRTVICVVGSPAAWSSARI
jgi:hypothetical protein